MHTYTYARTDLKIEGSTFLDQIDNGVILCRLIAVIQQKAAASSASSSSASSASSSVSISSGKDVRIIIVLFFYEFFSIINKFNTNNLFPIFSKKLQNNGCLYNDSNIFL